ncbi:MAG: hypothetical protein JWO31_1133 [Phycisphaerales bacterium]|nr:hypothetical protein [Phycisphaerales bacterium]
MPVPRIGQLVRSMVPPHARAYLRRSAVVRGALRLAYGGVRSKPYPHGPFTFWFDGGRDVGWAIADLAAAEAAEIGYVRRLLAAEPARCVWDVGANVGFWTLFFAGLQPPVVRTVAFEPDATNLRLLRMNLERNRLTDVVAVRDCALSDAAGEATFYADDVSGATGSLESGHAFVTKLFGQKTRPVAVPVSTIDAEVARLAAPPNFVKIDVEGHEAAVLRGAADTLDRYRPRLIVEVQPGNEEQVAEIFRAHRYRMFSPSTGAELARPAWNTVALPAGG